MTDDALLHPPAIAVLLPSTLELTLEPDRATPADRHPALVYLASLALGSRRTMQQALDVMAALLTGGRASHRTLPWHHLEYAHTAAVRAALLEQYAPATANKMLSALRGVLKEAWRLGYVDAETFHRAADIASVRGGTEIPAGRELTAGELRALLDACVADRTPAGVRDAAIFALLYGAGLRRAEAVRVDVAHVDFDAGAITVFGKGNKRRLAYARGGAATVLRAWLARRAGVTPPTLADASAPPLLVPVSQRGVIGTSRMSEKAIYKRLQSRAHDAGVRPFSPHDCRRTFAGDLLDAGADISSVQRLMGHASVDTTARYDRRGERAKRDAAELLHFPHLTFD